MGKLVQARCDETHTSARASCEELGRALLVRNAELAAAERLCAPQRRLSIELVDDVFQDRRSVVTASASDPCLLRYAVAGEVIRLAAKRGWRELLEEEQLAHSRVGRHLIGTYREEGSPHGHLVTTALVHSVGNWRVETPLDGFTVMREPFFGSSDFEPVCGRGHLEDAFDQAHRGQTGIPSLDWPLLPIVPASTRDFDECILYVLQPWRPVAIDRFTYSGPRPEALEAIYKTFVSGCDLLAANGHLVCLGVTYWHPFMAILTALSDLTGETCFTVISRRRATSVENGLHKLIVFNLSVARAASRIRVHEIQQRVTDTGEQR